MVKFFSDIFKSRRQSDQWSSIKSGRKKILFFVVLFFIFTILFLPNAQPANARSWFCLTIGLGTAACNQNPNLTQAEITATTGVSLTNAIFGDFCTNSVSKPFCYIIKFFLALIGTVFMMADLISTSVLNWMIGFLLSDISYTRAPIVSVGWPIVRNFANLVIVLGFIVIAVATILRIEGYKAQQLLVKLIVAALLVNFSLVICGLMIDVANIIIKFFTIQQNATDTIINNLNKVWGHIIDVNISPIRMAGTVVSLAFVGVMSAVTRGLFAFLFLFRIIAIWTLVILSPLAFVCYIFPATQKVWSIWWNNFWQWLIIGIPGAFFLYLATELQTVSIANMPRVSTPGGANVFVAGANDFLGALVPGLFLIVGFIFSLQVSAIGTGAAIGAFKGSAKYIRKAGKWGADKTGITRRAQAISDGISRGLERMGALKPGTTSANARARGKDAMADKDRQARIEAMSRDERIAELRANRSGLEAAYDRAKIMEEMAKDGEIHDGLPGGLSAAEIERFATEANNNGARAKNVAKDDYQVAEFDNSRVDDYIRDNLASMPNPGALNPITDLANRTAARERVRRQQLEDNVGSMTRKQIRTINPNDLDAETVSGGAFTPGVIRKFESAPDNIRIALYNTIGAIGTPGSLADQAEEARINGDVNEERRLNNLITAIQNIQ